MPSVMYEALMDPRSFETVAPRDKRHNGDCECVCVTMCRSILTTDRMWNMTVCVHFVLLFILCVW